MTTCFVATQRQLVLSDCMLFRCIYVPLSHFTFLKPLASRKIAPINTSVLWPRPYKGGDWFIPSQWCRGGGEASVQLSLYLAIVTHSLAWFWSQDCEPGVILSLTLPGNSGQASKQLFSGQGSSRLVRLALMILEEKKNKENATQSFQLIL